MKLLLDKGAAVNAQSFSNAWMDIIWTASEESGLRNNWGQIQSTELAESAPSS
jgi:hypothetical protein